MNLASDSAARNPSRGTFHLPNELFEDPYFTGEEHPLSRMEAVAWLAKHVRWTDNCVLKRGQGSWSLRFLAEAWKWTIKRVRCFLKACENRGFIRAAVGHIKGTAQMVISYMVQGLGEPVNAFGAQSGAQEGHAKGTKTKSGKSGKSTKEDSPPSGRFGFPDVEEVLRATTEPDPAPASEAAKPSPTEKRARARATAGDPEFDAFWAEMPEMARKRASKPETLKQWKLLTVEERAQARTVIPVWAEDGKYAKGAHRWLKLRMWESLVGQEPKPDRTKEDRECEMMY